jgi:hypothetical protein
MKAQIDVDGVLTITPENQTEAYALRRWSEEGDAGGVLHADYNASLPPRAKEHQ